jgi:hypothetical protein
VPVTCFVLSSTSVAAGASASPPSLPPPTSANVESPDEDLSETSRNTPNDIASQDDLVLEDDAPADEVERPPIQRPAGRQSRESAPRAHNPESEPQADDVPSLENAETDVTLPETSDPTTPERLDRAHHLDVPSTEGPTLRKESNPKKPEFRHNGFVMQALLGTMGCTRSLCAGRHGARPGVHVGGFIGGNIAGFVEVGAAGGWGQFNADLNDGTTGLDLFGIDGIDPALLSSDLGGSAFDPMMSEVQSSRLSSAYAGPHLRVHFIPRGRVTAFVGSGARYQLFRGDYDTSGGKARLDFHGLQVPIEGGLAVHVVKHVSLGVGFTYQWTHYFAMVLDTPSDTLALPLSVVQEQMESLGGDLRGELPRFWTVDASVRVNF